MMIIDKNAGLKRYGREAFLCVWINCLAEDDLLGEDDGLQGLTLNPCPLILVQFIHCANDMSFSA